MLFDEDAAGESENALGCLYTAYRSVGDYNVCVGSPCYYNSHCNSGCCSSYAGYCQYNGWCDNAVDLAWLWWTLASICLTLCIISMILGAKRRRRQMELAHAIHASNQNRQQHGETTTTTYVYYQGQPG